MQFLDTIPVASPYLQSDPVAGKQGRIVGDPNVSGGVGACKPRSHFNCAATLPLNRGIIEYDFTPEVLLTGPKICLD